MLIRAWFHSCRKKSMNSSISFNCKIGRWKIRKLKHREGAMTLNLLVCSDCFAIGNLWVTCTNQVHTASLHWFYFARYIICPMLYFSACFVLEVKDHMMSLDMPIVHTLFTNCKLWRLISCAQLNVIRLKLFFKKHFKFKYPLLLTMHVYWQ